MEERVDGALVVRPNVLHGTIAWSAKRSLRSVFFVGQDGLTISLPIVEQTEIVSFHAGAHQCDVVVGRLLILPEMALDHFFGGSVEGLLDIVCAEADMLLRA